MKPFWIATLAVIFAVLAVPSAGAIQPPEVTFIPDKISANSNFLMIADPHPLSGEIVQDISWLIPGIETNYTAYGYFFPPSSGSSKWVCYFSDTDSPSCGPSRFQYATTPEYLYTVIATADSNLDHENTTINVSVGGIKMTSNIIVDKNTVYIYALATGGIVQGGISYVTYDASTLTPVSGKSGTMTVFNPPLGGYNTSITLPNGEYYIAFTANPGTDFGGGVSRVTVGGTGPGPTTQVSYDNITYSPVINPGQKFKIETFRITNTGTNNLTALSVSVEPGIATYLTITPKQTSLEPNESTYLTVALENIQSSMNISTFANLKSGSTQLAQIPVNLMVSVLGSQNLSSCIGKADKTLCLGGICCGEVCRTGGADCCSGSDCSLDEECSSSFKCVPSVIPGECEGKNDSTTCQAGVCCSQKCVECCSDSDCSYEETCSSNNICKAPISNECAGKADNASCTDGICCDESCVTGGKCCADSDCDTTKGETCSSNSCVSGGNGGEGGGTDFVTIGLIIGGVAAAALVGFFLFKRFKKKGGEGDEELEPREEGEEEFSDEDFY